MINFNANTDVEYIDGDKGLASADGNLVKRSADPEPFFLGRLFRRRRRYNRYNNYHHHGYNNHHHGYNNYGYKKYNKGYNYYRPHYHYHG